ncbi:MAG: hypothetical protein MUO76_08035, partial [Anaerolineaceae bacterium]|nr:hypothetical protein [Anaerolineaceae bacterium]
PAAVNTDGGLYRCECFGGETATGVGAKIKPKGKWFMFNVYSDGDGLAEYDIQAGNPKGGENIIGHYWIIPMGGGWYRAEYSIDSAFDVVDEHLAISNSLNFTAAPGTDDNADFFVPFEAEAPFYIFAHFAVECAEQ